jgi:hypothetical protein
MTSAGTHPADPVPLENRIRLVACRAFRSSGGVRVLVDQAVENRSSADLQGIEVGPDAAEDVRFVVGGALGDALVQAVL